MSERERLLRRISSAQFAAWELHIFLDTHPNDDEALRSFKKYNEMASMLINEYESKYGPLSSSGANGTSRWNWVNEPWPWENCKEGR